MVLQFDVLQLALAVQLQQLSEYRISVAIPYIDHLIFNINGRFSDTAVKLQCLESQVPETMMKFKKIIVPSIHIFSASNSGFIF